MTGLIISLLVLGIIMYLNLLDATEEDIKRMKLKKQLKYRNK